MLCQEQTFESNDLMMWQRTSHYLVLPRWNASKSSTLIRQSKQYLVFLCNKCHLLEFCRIVAHPRVLEWHGITDDTSEFYDSFYDEMDSYDAITTYYDS